MVSALESTTPALLSLALDAAVMRQQAIAQNIANVNTPGYRSLSVSFEQNMAAQRSALAQGNKLSLASLSDYQPHLLQAADATNAANSVALDQEVANLAGNTLHHQVLLRALNKHFGLLSMAISEGKR